MEEKKEEKEKEIHFCGKEPSVVELEEQVPNDQHLSQPPLDGVHHLEHYCSVALLVLPSATRE
jgi:hypothetical protein